MTCLTSILYMFYYNHFFFMKQKIVYSSTKKVDCHAHGKVKDYANVEIFYRFSNLLKLPFNYL